MKNHDRQKIAEKEVFEQFLRLQNDIIPKDISITYDDEPDVILELPGKKVGVELRGLYISKAERELEGIKQSILLETRKACIERGIGNVSAMISFSPAFAGLPNPAYRVAEWSSKRKREIAEELASRIETRAASLLWGACDFRPDSKIPEVSDVFISKVITSKLESTTTPEHWWQVLNAGTVKYHVIPPIQEAIYEKGKKLYRYLERCDECWLLLYADRGKKAQRLDFREEDRGHRFKSKFSRAFYMERFHEDFHELHVTA